MATILERFEHLGLPHSNVILSKVGYFITQKYDEQNETGRRYKQQVEDGQTFLVWNYPNHWIAELDKLILRFIETNGQAD